MKYILSPLSLLSFRRVKSLLSFGVKGYLAEVGWFKAFDSKSSIDENGNPIPWVTYSFLDFIKDRINKNHKIFEFGSGNSTLFYAERAAKVVAVEHNQEWYKKVSSSKPTNAEILFVKLETNGDYCRTPLILNEKFDIIIVDGRDRVNCCKQCINALTEDGVVILDNTERSQYNEAIDFLLEKGFKHIPFTGIPPGVFIKNSTSLFYRSNNCLGI